MDDVAFVEDGLQIVREGGIGQELTGCAFTLLDAGGKTIKAGDELIQVLPGLAQIRAQPRPRVRAAAQFLTERGPRVEAHAEFLQNRQDRTADFLNRGFQRAWQLLADDGGILLGQRLALAARDLKIRIARHAEFLLDDRRRIRAHEAEEVAANARPGFHAAGRIDDDIGDRPHERAQKVHLRALPDARCARLGQNDP